jgi:hypothetical protein
MAEEITLADLTDAEKGVLRRVWMGTMERRFDAAMGEYRAKKARNKNLTFQEFLKDQGDYLTWAYSQMRLPGNDQTGPADFEEDWEKMSIDQKQKAMESIRRRGGRKTRRGRTHRTRSRRTRH